jgi:hypothetical protein
LHITIVKRELAGGDKVGLPQTVPTAQEIKTKDDKPTMALEVSDAISLSLTDVGLYLDEFLRSS